MLRFTQMDCR